MKLPMALSLHYFDITCSVNYTRSTVKELYEYQSANNSYPVLLFLYPLVYISPSLTRFSTINTLLLSKVLRLRISINSYVNDYDR